MRRLVLLTAIATSLIGGVTRGEYVDAVSGLRLRSAPSLEAEIVKVLPFGEEVNGEIKDGWMKTDDGYLKTDFLSKKNPLDDYDYMGNWMLTAYTHTGCACANGPYPTAGYTVACNSLPLGTEIYISEIGFRTVEDRGPQSMPGEWLDLFLDGYSECVSFGVQYHDVYIKKP